MFTSCPQKLWDFHHGSSVVVAGSPNAGQVGSGQVRLGQIRSGYRLGEVYSYSRASGGRLTYGVGSFSPCFRGPKSRCPYGRESKGRGRGQSFFCCLMYSQNARLKIKKCDSQMLLEIFDRQNKK
jgi:hypothetical protein